MYGSLLFESVFRPRDVARELCEVEQAATDSQIRGVGDPYERSVRAAELIAEDAAGGEAMAPRPTRLRW